MTEKHYFSTPPSAAKYDPWEFTIQAVLGIALTRQQLAKQHIERTTPKCADALAAVPQDCQMLLHTQGQAYAWEIVVSLLSEHMRAVREELGEQPRRRDGQP